MKKGMISANAVTCMRIVATAALIFTEPLSECFFVFIHLRESQMCLTALSQDALIQRATRAQDLTP